MNRFTSILTIALFAAAGLAACSDRSDETPAGQANGTAHAPSGDAADATTQAPTGATAEATPQLSAGDVRDWDAIDTNDNHLMEPDEIEAALKPVGPQAKE